MITAICQFAKLPFTATTSRFIAKSITAASIQNRISFPFTNGQNNTNVEEAAIEGEGENRAANFYRNSIRRININDKGRGKFTEHHLLRLIKLTEGVEQEPLLFEAYYNYLGHFTIISSTTVDKMLLKALSFEGCSIDKIIEIF